MSKTKFSLQDDGKNMVIEREFQANLDDVWQAWTTQDLLEKWWAPSPWKAVTKDFSFKEGGRWLYAMTGPDGEQHWSVEEYMNIKPRESFTAKDYFSDKQGEQNHDLPSNQWLVTFIQEDNKTKVKVVLTVEDEDDLKSLIKMGFKEGFNQGLDQLEKLLVS